MRRILADTGPLVALLDRRDADHEDCVAAARQLRGTLMTSWSVVTEAFYLLAPDSRAQDSLIGKIESGDLEVAGFNAADMPLIRALLTKYRDLPMDLADAMLVRLGDRERIDTVFTLDDDFRIYRLKGGKTFKIIP